MHCSAIICNNQSGRIRFRLLDKKGDKGYFEQIGQSLLNVDGIYSVQTNHVTASVLVLHKTTKENIIQQIKNQGFFEIKETQSQSKNITDAVRNSYEFLDSLTERYVGGLNIHSLVLASLIITGFYQLLRGNVGLPVWYVAFWYAMTLAKK